MTRSDLADKLAAKMKVSKQEADRYVLTILDAIISGVEKDGRLVVQGFGSFKVKEYKEKMGKKPITGEPIRIPAKRKPVFHAGKELREMVNRSGQPARMPDTQHPPATAPY